MIIILLNLKDNSQTNEQKLTSISFRHGWKLVIKVGGELVPKPFFNSQ